MVDQVAKAVVVGIEDSGGGEMRRTGGEGVRNNGGNGQGPRLGGWLAG